MASPDLSFDLLSTDPSGRTAGRCGTLRTPHGEVQTPVFMSVGTFGAVRTLDHAELERCGVQIILGNTYHLFLRPGAETLKAMGGWHKFISWEKPILTDSGGFQIFSLPHQRVIGEKGVTFKSYIDQSYKFITPESTIEFQELLGSDVMMPLDVCIPSTSARVDAVEAMERTHRWALRCLAARKHPEKQMLFGIVQGALFEDLRRESAAFLTAQPFDGFSIGGLAVGESEEERDHYTNFAAALLPQDKPRYLMGVGTPTDLVKAVAAGVDMFDCILPTNHARQGIAYTFDGKVKMRRQALRAQDRPIDSSCACPTCARYSRAYLHQLIKSDEYTGWKLIAFHNTWFYERLMERMREAIPAGTLDAFRKQLVEAYEADAE